MSLRIQWYFNLIKDLFYIQMKDKYLSIKHNIYKNQEEKRNIDLFMELFKSKNYEE